MVTDYLHTHRKIRLYILILLPKNTNVSHLTLSFTCENDCHKVLSRYLHSDYIPDLHTYDLVVSPTSPYFEIAKPLSCQKF